MMVMTFDRAGLTRAAASATPKVSALSYGGNARSRQMRGDAAG